MPVHQLALSVVCPRRRPSMATAPRLRTMPRHTDDMTLAKVAQCRPTEPTPNRLGPKGPEPLLACIAETASSLQPQSVPVFFFWKKSEVKSHSQSNEAIDALTCGACPTTHRSPMEWGRSRLVPSRRRGTAQKTELQCKRGDNSTCATKPPSRCLAMEVGASRDLAFASATKNWRDSWDHLPPTSVANTTNRARPPSPDNSG